MKKSKSVKLTRAVFEAKLKKIRMLLLDVDGVLTAGELFYTKGQGWTRIYHVHDGYGIRHMLRQGFPIGIISGGRSEELFERVNVLGIEHYVLGSEDKLSSMIELSKKTGILPKEMAFIGDELFDIPALQEVGLAITVPTCAPEVKEIAHWVTTKEGGRGAVREVIDMIRKVQKLN
ncbi:MAG: HAD hydrolase family protein [Bdellovibrionales bacterium]|nr:HAD hydrolase family protein [Bdellovibrionales bacterium]